jgi:hypothetical protein
METEMKAAESSLRWIVEKCLAGLNIRQNEPAYGRIRRLSGSVRMWTSLPNDRSAGRATDRNWPPSARRASAAGAAYHAIGIERPRWNGHRPPSLAH